MPFCEPKAVRTDWETPAYIFDPLNAEFGFHRDVCATHENRKCAAYWSIEDNALVQEWHGTLWMNPPYGREIGKWIEKAYDAACDGATVVCLLPVRSANDWWKYVIQAEVRFIRHKIRFVGAPFNSMFPNCIAVFHAHLDPGAVMKVWKP